MMASRAFWRARVWPVAKRSKASGKDNDPLKASPFRKVSANRRSAEEPSVEGLAARIRTLAVAVRHAEVDAHESADALGGKQSEAAIRRFYFDYFEWRLGCGRLYGAARSWDERVSPGRGARRLSPHVRATEREATRTIRERVRGPLELAAGARDARGSFPTAAAARELARDLNVARASLPSSDSYLRVGTLRSGDPGAHDRWIQPHASGLVRVGIPSTPSSIPLGTTVVYFCRETKDKARDVTAVPRVPTVKGQAPVALDRMGGSEKAKREWRQIAQLIDDELSARSRPRRETPARRTPAEIVGEATSAADERLLLSLPESLPGLARERALAGSSRLRVERRLVPAATLEISTPNGKLIFDPIVPGENPLEARFAFLKGSSRMRGALRLRRPADPLALRVEDGADESVIAEAWAAALIVYAELTCADLGDMPSSVPPEIESQAVTRPRPPQFPAERDRSSGVDRQRHRHEASPTRLLTAHSLREALAQLEAVAGHLRRLRPGASASHEARRAAEAAGIHLPPGFTWVRPHHRGGAMTVRIRWPIDVRLW